MRRLRKNSYNGRKKDSFSVPEENPKIRIIIGLVAVVLLFNLLPISKSIKNLFYAKSEALVSWIWEKGIASSGLLKAMVGFQGLIEENRQLKRQNIELLYRSIELEGLRQENEELKTALGLELQEDFDLEMAKVIAKETGSDFLVINRGSKNGVDVDFPVITQDRVLIGKIAEVYENYSRIRLLTAKDASFEVKISDKSVRGLAKGEGNFNLSIDLVPKEKEISEGDRIITGASGGNFPENLLAGEIESVRKTDVSAFQEIQAKPLFELSGLSDVFIILNFN